MDNVDQGRTNNRIINRVPGIVIRAFEWTVERQGEGIAES